MVNWELHTSGCFRLIFAAVFTFLWVPFSFINFSGQFLGLNLGLFPHAGQGLYVILQSQSSKFLRDQIQLCSTYESITTLGRLRLELIQLPYTGGLHLMAFSSCFKRFSTQYCGTRKTGLPSHSSSWSGRIHLPMLHITTGGEICDRWLGRFPGSLCSDFILLSLWSS